MTQSLRRDESAILSAAIDQLTDRSSPKRRSAAKKLRKLGASGACVPLMDALLEELKDDRTWETQYQLIMALAECRCVQALPTIRQLANTNFWSEMRIMAVGDAMVRLGREFDADPSPVFEALTLSKKTSPALASGAVRAVAMLQIRFDDETAQRLIVAVEDLGDNDAKFWTAAACAGWGGPAVEKFLRTCIATGGEEMRQAAQSSLLGKYRVYHPL